MRSKYCRRVVVDQSIERCDVIGPRQLPATRDLASIINCNITTQYYCIILRLYIVSSIYNQLHAFNKVSEKNVVI